MSQTALVTGATAGIGLAFAQQLADQRYDLVLVARDAVRLEETAAELRTRGVQVEVLVADLNKRKELAKVEARVASKDTPIDLLVNNAGYGLKYRFIENSTDDEEGMLNVLVTAVMRLSHAAIVAMNERGSGGIINVSSVAGFLPRGTYSAAKAYVNSFTEWAHHEYAPAGITVMALCPGFTRTEFHGRMGVSQSSAPDWLWLDVNDLVATALKDFAKGKAFSIPSPQYKAIVGISKAVPKPILQRFQKLGRAAK
ncbi:dehydrogenase [Nocardioides baekrokdamisoli]|uniref:Dehydrogenase n=1 Tax=Nocardioides baekrokdamisoli TaxID=1804624 RepID=A0A3G9IDP6_9ACTN|nr:SDR family oxidoreductase [Nocardioides baekrokdamisoli]BBH16476.1 dehydrogenase [Nocardioides baekrokdamisoli]